MTEHIDLFGIFGLGLAIFGIFAPYRWREMHRAVTNFALILGVSLMAISAWLEMSKFIPAPTVLLVISVVGLIGGLAWHYSGRYGWLGGNAGVKTPPPITAIPPISPPPDLSKNEGVLIPANLPMLPLPPGCKLPDNALAVFMGSNVTWNTKFPHTVLEIADEPMIVIDFDKNTENLKVTVLRIFDDRGDIIARIDEDGFWVQNSVRKKRPDESTLVVYDHNDTEVLKIEFLNKRAISVQGVFRHTKAKPYYLVVKPDRIIEVARNNVFIGNCIAASGPDLVLAADGRIGFGGRPRKRPQIPSIPKSPQ